MYRPALVSIGFSVVWLGLALRSPTTTYHLVPGFVAAGWPLTARHLRGQLRFSAAIRCSVAGFLVAVATTIGLGWLDVLRGPAIFGGSAAVESAIVALAAAVWGVHASIRPTRGRLLNTVGTTAVVGDDAIDGNVSRSVQGFSYMLPKRSSSVRVFAVATAAFTALAACGGADTADRATVVPSAPTDSATPDDASETAAAITRAFATATPLDDISFDASSLAGTDTVLWFWAPWCTTCRGEAPEVAEVAERYVGSLQVIGVPGRGELGAMRDFVEDTGTDSITHIADIDGATWSAFGIYGQPAYAFIDDSGSIEVFIGGMGGDALAERIDELIAS